MELKVKLDKDSIMPNKAHKEDAGFDLFSRDTVTINPNSSQVFDTGVHIQIPYGYVGFLKSKSGLNVKYNLTSEGVIDAGYTGSICVKMYNHGDSYYMVHKGDKITQLVILPIPEVSLIETETLDASDRGDNGFGSTGK